MLDSEGNIIRIITNSRDVSEFYDLKAKLAETESLMQRYMSEVEMLRKECLISDDVVVKAGLCTRLLTQHEGLLLLTLQFFCRAKQVQARMSLLSSYTNIALDLPDHI